MSKRHIASLCDDGWLCQGCPEILVDEKAEVNQQLCVTDDFGNTVEMSKDQVRHLINQAKMGRLDRI